MPDDRPVLEKERHVKYWLRCLKTYLPNNYTLNDSNRMTLAFFTLSALDILGVLHEKTTVSERADYVNWIYHCQHPNGGFRGFTGSIFDAELKQQDNEHWDPANLAGTFFGLAALIVLGDDLERVRRRECLKWLARLQLPDGNFGEVLGEAGEIEGGGDVRFSFFAALVRRILRCDKSRPTDVQDVDIDGLVRFIRASKTYDGGIAQAPYCEAHGGSTYCGIGALNLLGRLQQNDEQVPETKDEHKGFVQDILHWLVWRQTTHLSEDSEFFDIFDRLPSQTEGNHHHGLSGQCVTTTTPAVPATCEDLSDHQIEGLRSAGFNGRCNKIADTCYSFWIGGTLDMLEKVKLVDQDANRRYLLDKTQHAIGGFGKLPGDPPDILHSYFGLAALAVMKEPGLERLDSTLCISMSAREHLDSLSWRKDGKEI